MRKIEERVDDWGESREDRQMDWVCRLFTIVLIMMVLVFALMLMKTAIDSLLTPYGMSAREVVKELLGELRRFRQ